MSEEDIGKGNSQLAMMPSLGATPYPPPLAKYEEVVASTALFMRTLEKLHIMMGTKFMVPTIGGKELDLHRLFVEVTYRGGLEKVIKERKWKEITAVFNFPSTATNASFILRKYYFSLMHHYEQIYFFRAHSWTAPEQKTPTAIPAPHSVDPITRSLIQGGGIQKGRKSSDEGLPRANTPITGFIDGKFDHGYLVTVKVGTQRLRGVLYHTTAYPEAGIPRDSGIVHNGNKDAATSGIRRRRRRKKSEMRKRDPYHPKPNRSGYNFFFAEQHARLKLLHSGKDREISRMIGELWNKLTETEKAVYQERGVKDKERYQSEMEEYRERLKMGPIVSNAVPIQQRLPESDLEMVDADSRTETEGGCLPLDLENGSSSSESDSEDITPENNFEWEKYPEIRSVTETSKIVTEVSMGGAGFEQQRRNSVDMDINVPGASLGNESELMKKDPATESELMKKDPATESESMKKDPSTEMDSSNVPGASSGNESELMKKDPATESESMKKDPATEMDSSNVPGAISGNESELMKKDPATGIDSSNVTGASSGNESELMKKDPATGIDSSNVSGASLGDDSELLKKDPATKSESMKKDPATVMDRNKVPGTSLGDESESKKKDPATVMDSSNVPGASLGDESESMKKDPATVMDSSNVMGASLGDESESMKKHPATEMDSSNVPVASLGDKPELMTQDRATDSESMKEDPSTDRH